MSQNHYNQIMKTKNTNDIERLRQKAEEYLTKFPSTSDLKLFEANNLKLIHELQVHQIELEMQNDELKKANVKSELEARKYIELYNFSSFCYFTLSKEGEIVELNLKGSHLLGKELSHLIGSRFGFFVSNEDKPIFNLFLEKVFIRNVNETCLISLVLDDNKTKHVILKGKITLDSNYCLISAIDNTELIDLQISSKR